MYNMPAYIHVRYYLGCKSLKVGALYGRCTVQTRLAFSLSEFAAKQEAITLFLQRFLLFTFKGPSLISKMALPVGGPEVFLAEK